MSSTGYKFYELTYPQSIYSLQQCFEKHVNADKPI